MGISSFLSSPPQPWLLPPRNPNPCSPWPGHRLRRKAPWPGHTCSWQFRAATAYFSSFGTYCFCRFLMGMTFSGIILNSLSLGESSHGGD